MTRLTTMAAMPASTALAVGDDKMSIMGFDPATWPLGAGTEDISELTGLLM